MGETLYDPYIQQASSTYNVPVDILESIIGAESNWDPYATNKQTGAQGLGQVLPSTAAQPGYGIAPLSNPYDPQSNINFVAQYLSALYQKFGNWLGAIDAYSGTPQGQQPYQGNNQQANVLSAISNNSGTSGTGNSNPQASPDTSAASNQSGCTGWISTPVACITATVTEVGLVVLALIIIAFGVAALARKEVPGA